MFKLVQASAPTKEFNGIVIVGEAPGVDETVEGKPFVGASGKLLDPLLKFAGIEREACYVTNVFQVRPPRNDLSEFFAKKSEADSDDKLGAFRNYYHPQLGYLKAQYHTELIRLRGELLEVKPKLIVAMGGTALWALTGQHKITEYRGTVMMDEFNRYKVVPTFHPAAALRDYSMRPIIACDLQKAASEVGVEGIKRPKRKVFIVEGVEDMKVAVADIKETHIVAFDVETVRKPPQITCISLAATSDRAYVVPFWNMNKRGYNNFDEETELFCWAALAEILHDPSVVKIAHNSLYDLTYCEGAGIKPAGRVEDTMLMAHSWQVEWPKSLGFLGSIFCNERAWKNMRVGAKKNDHKGHG